MAHYIYDYGSVLYTVFFSYFNEYPRCEIKNV